MGRALLPSLLKKEQDLPTPFHQEQTFHTAKLVNAELLLFINPYPFRMGKNTWLLLERDPLFRQQQEMLGTMKPLLFLHRQAGAVQKEAGASRYITPHGVHPPGYLTPRQGG